MSEVEEAAEQAREHAHGEGHGLEGENKRVALLIAILALLLAIAEIMGQGAQTEALQKNIEASNLWAHFQAKTIRMTLTETAAEQMQAMLSGITEPNLKKTMQTQVATFKATAQRMDSDAASKDGRRELGEQAREAEGARDKFGRKHHRFELAKGAFQIGIVLASATVITGIAALLWAAGGLGAIGAVLLLAGMLV